MAEQLTQLNHSKV